MTSREILIQKANEVMENSYSPYSNFKVGAAILLRDGKIITGVNVENASFGATMCAERSAIFAAVSLGYKKGDFQSMAITSELEDVTPPCGLCRQVMLEFFENDKEIILTNKKGEYKVTNMNELVPYQFTSEELKDV
jgi:cytidine deaminase